MTAHLEFELERLERLYDPESDLISNAPRVTHTDRVLLDAIKDLRKRLAALEEGTQDEQ